MNLDNLRKLLVGVTFACERFPWLPPGQVLFDRTRNVVLVRHFSELLHAMAGATVHYSRSTCHTWTDVAECRCMVE